MATPRRPRFITRVAVVLLGTAAAAAVAGVPMNNSIGTAVAGFWALVGVTLLDVYVVTGLTGAGRPAMVCRVIAATVIGGAIGNWFRLDADWAFQAAFGMEPPATVRGLTANGMFVGRQSDKYIHLRFNTDHETIERLAGRMWRDTDFEQRLADPSRREMAWRHFLIDPSETLDWASGPSSRPAAPRVYRWASDEDLEIVTLVWDPATGRALALYIYG